MTNALVSDGGVVQMCFVTHDLDQTANWLGELLGVPAGPVVLVAPDADATYRGAPGVFTCRIRFIELGNITVEIIEPGPEKSAWRDVLETKGPGFHHIGIKTRNMKKHRAFLEERGHAQLQFGGFAGGGGRYAYFDTLPQLGAMIELLESDDDMEHPA